MKHKKERKNTIKYFIWAKNKADSVGMLIIQAIIDLDISHEEFKTINEKKDYGDRKNIINEVRLTEVEMVHFFDIFLF